MTTNSWVKGCVIRHPVDERYFAWDRTGVCIDDDGFGSYDEAKAMLARWEALSASREIITPRGGQMS